jgi:hypothetical protein
MFVFKYIRKDNGELLGYHLDTFGNLGSKEHAKRYGDYEDTPERKVLQTKSLQRNLESRLDPKEGSWLENILKELKATDYQGLEADQIELVLEEVEYVDVVLKVHTIIHADGTIENK